MTPFKTILLSLLVSLTACLCFTYPILIPVVLYFTIGMYVHYLGKRINSFAYDEVFSVLAILIPPAGMLVLLLEEGWKSIIEKLIPGYTITIEKGENEK